MYHLAGLDVVQRLEDLRHEGAQLGQAIADAVQNQEAHLKSLQWLLKRQICIHGEEGVELTLRQKKEAARS